MRRRPVLAGLAAVLAPGLAPASAFAHGTRRIGVLMGYGEGDPGAADYITALTRALNAQGWRVGANIEVSWRWADGQPDLFERHAAELVALKPDVLVAQGTPSVKALRPRAKSIPIVFTIVTDPVGQGMVESLAHPGGTLTGFTDFDPAMAGKWMEFLSQVVPAGARVAALFNPETAPFAAPMLQAIAQAAPSSGLMSQPAPCGDQDAIEAALAACDAAVALPDLFNLVNRAAIVAAAARRRRPMIYFNRIFTQAGGLMSYGVDYADQFARAGLYVDRLLRGGRVADLPVQQPTQFDLSLNLRTARALGLELPRTMLSVADDVIE
jgi:putative ABC transport system substrate-binding protein